MRLRSRHRWLAAYTALFAVLAAYVFWGTWSPDFAPVMPDCPIAYPADWFRRFWNDWLDSGRFIPNDLRVFLGSPYHWQELNYVVAVYSSSLALAYFLRGRGLSFAASYGGALFLAFSGYWLTLFNAGHSGWFLLLTWCVWPLGLIDRAVRKNKMKNWLLSGAVVGWAGYNQPDIFLIFMLFTAAFFVYVCVRERRIPGWKGILAAALAVFLVGGAGFYRAIAFDLSGREKQLAAGDNVSEKDKAAGDEEARWVFVTNWSLPSDEIAEFFIPRLNGDTSCPITLSIGARYRTGVTRYTGAIGRPRDAPRGNYRQHSVYCGFITCLLAVLAVAGAFRRDSLSRRKDVLFLAGAAVVFCLCSLGRYCEPVYRVIFLLPFGDMVRCPVKWHHLTELCLAALAGFGLETLLSILRSFNVRGKTALACVSALIAVGGIDLAYHAKFFCAPVDVSKARQANCNMNFAFLRRADFNRPEVASMVRSGRIVSQANPDPDTYLVGVLEPWQPDAKPHSFSRFAALSVVAWLSFLSICAFGVGLPGFKRKT